MRMTSRDDRAYNRVIDYARYLNVQGIGNCARDNVNCRT